MSPIVCEGPSPAPVAAMTLILDTTVFGFRSVIEKVVSLVVLVISLLPFTEYLIVYLLRMSLRGIGSFQVSRTLKNKQTLFKFKVLQNYTKNVPNILPLRCRDVS